MTPSQLHTGSNQSIDVSGLAAGRYFIALRKISLAILLTASRSSEPGNLLDESFFPVLIRMQWLERGWIYRFDSEYVQPSSSGI